MTDPSVAAETPRAGPGRPRDPDRHQAVLDATRELLLEMGYGALNIDVIAKRAEVSRRLVYRWWGQKARIVAEVLFAEPADDHVPDTGTVAGDIRALVESTVKRYLGREMVLGLPGLQADIAADAELMEEVRSTYTRSQLQRWHVVLDRAKSRGEIAPGQNYDAIARATVGAITVLVQEHTFPHRKDLADFVTDFALNGIHRRGGKKVPSMKRP